MNLKSYLFYDQTDDTETEVVCESIDTALLIKEDLPTVKCLKRRK